MSENHQNKFLLCCSATSFLEYNESLIYEFADKSIILEDGINEIYLNRENMRVSQHKKKIRDVDYSNHIVMSIILSVCVMFAFTRNRNHVTENQYLLKGRCYSSVNDISETNMDFIEIYVDGNVSVERFDSLMFVANHATCHIDSFVFHPRRYRTYMMEYYCRENSIDLPVAKYYYDSYFAPPTEDELNDWKRDFFLTYNQDMSRLTLVSDLYLLNGQKISSVCLRDSMKRQQDRPLLIDLTNNNKISDLVSVYTLLMEAYDAKCLADLFRKKKILLLMPFDKKILQSISADVAGKSRTNDLRSIIFR